MAELQSEVPLNLFEPSDHLNHSYSLRARKAAKNYDMFRAKNDELGVQFGGGDQTSLRNMGDGSGSDSGYCSPPLWKSVPETKKLQQLDYQYLSAETKSQAVARGQRELMELIKNMPESDYELTLKDLVERHRKPTGEETEGKEYRSSDTLYRKEEGGKEKNGSREIFRKQQKKRNDHKNIQKPVLRSSSSLKNNNGGFLLNMVLPLGFGFGKKKKINPKATGLVSPKPLPPPVLDGEGKAIEKEWWKKRFSGSGGSESLGRSSNNSGSTGSSGSSSSSRSTRSINKEKSGFGSGCWVCFGVKNQKE